MFGESLADLNCQRSRTSVREMARNFDQLLERVMRTARLGEFA